MSLISPIILQSENFGVSSSNVIRELRNNSDFYDVALRCSDSNGKSLQAHKVVISAFSSVFRDMIYQDAQMNSSGHSSMFFRGISHYELSCILDFIYQGEASISEERLISFLSVAEDLKIEGISTVRVSCKDESKDRLKGSQNNNALSRSSALETFPIQGIDSLEETPSTLTYQHNKLKFENISFDVSNLDLHCNKDDQLDIGTDTKTNRKQKIVQGNKSTVPVGNKELLLELIDKHGCFQKLPPTIKSRLFDKVTSDYNNVNPEYTATKKELLTAFKYMKAKAKKKDLALETERLLNLM